MLLQNCENEYPWCRLLLLVVVVLASQGCRSLRSHRQTRELSLARQVSLQGVDELQQEKWDEAETLFTAALSHSLADERAHWGMAEVQWERGNRQLAIEHMEQAVRISGENPDLLVRLGEMHLAQGKLEKALENSDRALERARSHSSAWALRGRVLRRRGNPQDAMQCYHRALISRSDNTEVQIELAEIYQELGRPQRALATLDRLNDFQQVAGGGSNASVLILRGRALADLGERAESHDCLRQAALCADDTDTELLLQLTRAQLEAGELAEARVCLGRTLRANPQNPQALALQGELDAKFREFVGEHSLSVLPAAFGTQPSSEN